MHIIGEEPLWRRAERMGTVIPPDKPRWGEGASTQGCLICGYSEGACTGHQEAPAMPASPLHDHSALVLVTEEVIERTMPLGVTDPRNASKTILFHANQVVPRSAVAKAEERGVEVPFTTEIPEGVGARPYGILDLSGQGADAPGVEPGVSKVVGSAGETVVAEPDPEVDSPEPDPEVDDDDPASIEFDPESFPNIGALQAFAEENEIDLDGATKRDDIENAIAADPRVVTKSTED